MLVRSRANGTPGSNFAALRALGRAGCRHVPRGLENPHRHPWELGSVPVRSVTAPDELEIPKKSGVAANFPDDPPRSPWPLRRVNQRELRPDRRGIAMRHEAGNTS